MRSEQIKEMLEYACVRLGISNPLANAHDFIRWNELTSFEVMSNASASTIDAITQNLMEDSQHSDLDFARALQGGLFSWFYGIDKILPTIRQHLPRDVLTKTWEAGVSSLATFNGECWPLPSGEYAILLNAGLVFFFDGAATRLLDSQAHLYVDVDDLYSMEKPSKSFSEALVDWCTELTRNFMSAVFEISRDQHRLGAAYKMNQLFLTFLIGHELGHVKAQSGLMRGNALRVRVEVDADMRPIAWEDEYQADEFSFLLNYKIHGPGIVSAIDFWVRLNTLYEFIFGVKLGGGTHPELGRRFVKLLGLARKNDIIDAGTNNMIIDNHIHWLNTIVRHLSEHRVNEIQALRRFWRIRG
jgi:hypothetical protein